MTFTRKTTTTQPRDPRARRAPRARPGGRGRRSAARERPRRQEPAAGAPARRDADSRAEEAPPEGAPPRSRRSSSRRSAPTPTPPSRRPTSPREEIAKRNMGQEMPYLLEDLPVDDATTPTPGIGNGYTYVSMRGIGPTRINFTLDGAPLNEPEDSTLYFVDFGDLASSVESLQVQRGVGTSAAGVASFVGSVNFASLDLAESPGDDRALLPRLLRYAAVDGRLPDRAARRLGLQGLRPRVVAGDGRLPRQLRASTSRASSPASRTRARRATSSSSASSAASGPSRPTTPSSREILEHDLTLQPDGTRGEGRASASSSSRPSTRASWRDDEPRGRSST